MTLQPPEFSRLIAIEGITPDKTRAEEIEATEEECAALAQRFDLRGLSGLKARLGIRRVAGGEVVQITGSFEAEVVQACVVSLRDVYGQVNGKVDSFFTENKSLADAEDDDDAPEIAVGGQIDLGEVVAQHLSLELNPYPRAPGVSLAAQMTEAGVELKNSPFQVLEGAKKGAGKGKKDE